jgi:hypothetical protein
VRLRLNNKEIERGPDFRWDIEYDISGIQTLIVWIRKESIKPIELIISEN